MRRIFLLAFSCLIIFGGWACARDEIKILAPLIDPAKLDTLSASRAANPRLKKIAYWLETMRREGKDVGDMIDSAQKADGCGGTQRAAIEKAALMRNLTILDRLGCLTDEGMERLRKGDSPIITNGPYAGDIATVDHIIPRAAAPRPGGC